MRSKGSDAADEEIAALIARLRAEARASGVPVSEPQEVGDGLAPLVTRREAEELWAVSSDRPFVSKHGRWGRFRGTLLTPLKFLLKKLMRWYVEPPFSDQRTFNAAALRLIDEFHLQAATMIGELEERITRLEDEDSLDSKPR